MKNSLTTRICTVIVFLALIAFWLLVGVGVYTNGFQSVKSHYITCDGQVVKSDAELELCDRSPVFTLTGAGFKAAEWGEYTLSITANPQAEITYKAYGKEYKAENTDLTAGFAIERQGNKFTITSGDYSLQTVLREITGKRGLVVTNFSQTVAPYILTVTDGNGNSYSCMLNHILAGTGITLKPDEIIAG